MKLRVKIEHMITGNQRTYYENGAGLKLIRDLNLYEEVGLKSFVKYVETKLDIQVRHAYRMMDAYDIVSGLITDLVTNNIVKKYGAENENRPDEKSCPMGQGFENYNDVRLSPIGDNRIISLQGLEEVLSIQLPANERQARALKPIEPKERAAVWKIACSQAVSDGENVTADRVEIAVATFLGGGVPSRPWIDPKLLEQMTLPFHAVFDDLTAQIQSAASNAWKDTSREAIIYHLKTLTEYVKRLEV